MAVAPESRSRQRGGGILRADQHFSPLLISGSLEIAVLCTWVSRRGGVGGILIKLHLQLFFLSLYLSKACTPTSLPLKQCCTCLSQQPTKALLDQS